MACLKKLDADIDYDCANLGNLGGVGEIDEAILINSSDISSFSVTNGSGALVMMPGKKGFVVTSVNNSIMYQDAIKTSDIVPSGEEHSVVLKVLKSSDTSTKYRVTVGQLLGGNYRAALKSKTGNYYLAGAFCGLEASDLVTDSSTGGISTVTLKTPEGATGDTLVTITKADYDGLKIPKV